MRSMKRRGFNLLEVMLSLFILALGLIMVAGSLPVALKSAHDSNDLTVSSLIARGAAARVQMTGGLINFDNPPAAVDTILWYDTARDQAVVPGGGPALNWIKADPGAWGMAIPYPGDQRYAYQVFFRKRDPGAAPPAPAPAPSADYDVWFVVQVQRDGEFRVPVDNAGQTALLNGDLWCDAQGRWQRYRGTAEPNLVWGLPGAVMSYQTLIRF